MAAAGRENLSAVLYGAGDMRLVSISRDWSACKALQLILFLFYFHLLLGNEVGTGSWAGRDIDSNQGNWSMW